jgi:hypothetical protein
MNTDKTSLENESQPSCLGAVSSSILSPDEYIKQNDGKMQHEYLKQDKIRYDWFVAHMKNYAEYVYTERTKIASSFICPVTNEKCYKCNDGKCHKRSMGQ